MARGRERLPRTIGRPRSSSSLSGAAFILPLALAEGPAGGAGGEVGAGGVGADGPAAGMAGWPYPTVRGNRGLFLHRGSSGLMLVHTGMDTTLEKEESRCACSSAPAESTTGGTDRAL
jgi:hypothetical protein